MLCGLDNSIPSMLNFQKREDTNAHKCGKMLIPVVPG